MNCKSVSLKLGGYLDGELAGSEMIAIRTHLNRCDACAEEAESLRSLKSALYCLPCSAPPVDFEEKLLRAVRSQTWPAMGRRRRGFLWGAALMAASAAGFVGVWLSVAGNGRPDASAVAANTAQEASFELSRDQAYEAASDNLSGHSILVTASYGNR